MVGVITRAAAAAFLSATLGGAAFAAPAPKAQCKLFKKTSDGKWFSTVASKVGNPKEFVTLQPGIPIDPKLVVAGINVSETIEKLCGGQ